VGNWYGKVGSFSSERFIEPKIQNKMKSRGHSKVGNSFKSTGQALTALEVQHYHDSFATTFQEGNEHPTLKSKFQGNRGLFELE
jgi:hypothetical protein